MHVVKTPREDVATRQTTVAEERRARLVPAFSAPGRMQHANLAWFRPPAVASEIGCRAFESCRGPGDFRGFAASSVTVEIAGDVQRREAMFSTARSAKEKSSSA